MYFFTIHSLGRWFFIHPLLSLLGGSAVILEMSYIMHRLEENKTCIFLVTSLFFSVFLGIFQCIVSLRRFVFRTQAAPDEVWSVVCGVSAARLCCAEPQRFLFIAQFLYQNTQDRVFLTSLPKTSQSDRWLSFCIADCYPRASSDCSSFLESSAMHHCLGEQSDAFRGKGECDRGESAPKILPGRTWGCRK